MHLYPDVAKMLLLHCSALSSTSSSESFISKKGLEAMRNTMDLFGTNRYHALPQEDLTKSMVWGEVPLGPLACQGLFGRAISNDPPQ